MQMTFTIFAPYLLLRFLQICYIFARIMLVQIHFFCPVIYMLKVPDRGRRELGMIACQGLILRSFSMVPPPYLKGLNKQRPQLPEGLVIVAAT